MNSQLRQTSHIAKLTTPFGDDVLVLDEFDGHEGLGELFEYRIFALSEKQDLPFDQALGQKCSVTYKSFDKERVFNGYLVEAEWLGMKGYLASYRLVLRPWLWLLSRKSDCRIFENTNALKIIEEVFNEHGFEFRKATTESYPDLEYCVQYRETDLAFVSRLMEQHGIYYFFEHEAGKHTLVLADGKSSHKTNPDCSPLPFFDHGVAGGESKQHVSDWSTRRRFRSGKVEFKDYNFEQSTANMVSKGDGPGRYSKGDMQIYDYPGKYKKQSDGEKYAKVLLQSEQALDQRRHASGNAANVFPGSLITLSKHQTESENIEYLAIRATHSISMQAYRSGDDSDPDKIYNGSYEFLPTSVVFRSPIVTPDPLIHGIQTAMVVAEEGNEDEEIHVDKYGRIRVEFHWVRPDKKTGKKKPSCWLRVAQVWSGKKWGGQIIPRVGMEVVVEFLEGDPDRPLVIGTVYNDKYELPYELPENKTQSGVKSDSSKGHNGYNEFMFEDKAGSEKIGLHAEKDLDAVVRHKETRKIGETFLPPMGSPSREVTLVSGDDKLTVQTGNRDVMTAMKHSTQAGMQITEMAGLQISETVAGTSVMLDPSGILQNAPMLTVNTAVTTLNCATVTINGTLIINGAIVLNGKPMV